jgi:acyl-CoA synthetase (AMP-forming)/AMP-acid ligase II
MTNTMLTLLSAERLAEHYGTGHWRDTTIYMQALAHAERHPGRYAIRDAARRLTYRELIEAADRLAGRLRAYGVRPGQRVAVWLSSRAETAVALLACSRNGFVCCPSLHRDHTVGEVVELLQRMRAAALIAEAGYGADGDRRDVFQACSQGLPDCRQIRLERNEEGCPFLSLPLREGAGGRGPTSVEMNKAAGASPAGRHNSDPNRVIYLAFTSGTTGQPKGVMHSDNTLLSNARALAQDWKIDRESVVYTLSPLSHNLGLGAMITALAVGGELVVHDLPRGRGLLDRLQEVGATFLFGVPTHAIDLLAELRARGNANLGKVRGFRISGAAASSELIHELMRHGVMPQSGYGMTETCSHQYTLPTDDPALIAESCGRSCPGYEIRIFRQDNPDVEAAVGEVGHIGGRGASLMLGYFDDQAATEAAFNSAGWFMTGDLGWVDANGYLRITGRKKDVIIRGGHNIHPARIECLASKHPEIEKAAAVPVKDERLGERVCLAVVPRNGATIDPSALLRHLDEAGLSKYDMPEYMLFLDDMPVTASGKTLKRELVRRIEEGELQPSPVRFQRAV